MLNSPENLRYFKEPIFIWTQLPDAEATVIITYVSAAILPIVALLMTSMITNYLTDQQEEQKLLESKENPFNTEENTIINQNSILQMENQGLQESNKKKDEELARIKQELEELKENKKDDRREADTEDTSDNNDNEQQLGRIEDKGSSESELSESISESNEGESESKLDESIQEGIGIEKTTEKKLDKEVIEEDVKKRNSHFINL